MSERITITDGSLSIELDRWLLELLLGTPKDDGLYHLMSHSIVDWDTYNFKKGQVIAYENVRRKMVELAQQRGDALEEQVIISRSGMN